MSRIIAPEYLKEFIFHKMAESNENTRGLEIISLPRLLNEEEPLSDAVFVMQLRGMLKKKKDEFSCYAQMFDFPSFYNEILSFARQLALWQIRADELPGEDENQKQLRQIVSLALSLPLPEIETARNADAAIRKAVKEKMILMPAFESSLWMYTVTEQMQKAGIVIRPVTDSEPANISRRHGLTEYKEAEGCAQEICRNEKPCTVILCNPDAQLPAIRQIFERFGIPFSCTTGSFKAAIGHCYRALAEFAVNPDAKHLIAVLETQALKYPCDEKLLDFLRQVLNDIKPPAKAQEYRQAYEAAQSEKYDPLKALQKDPVTLYEQMEEAAAEYFAKIQDTIDNLAGCALPKEKLIRSYEALVHSPLLASPQEMHAGRAILSLLQDCAQLAEDDDDVIFLSKIAEQTSSSSSGLTTDFCTVTDLRHPVFGKENTYVLGCSGKNYPGFSPMSGLFDENYVRLIDRFPSLEKRQQAYEQQLSWILKSCSGELIFSHASNDYQGRQEIAASELEIYGKSIRWQIVHNGRNRTNDYSLSAETAHALFEKNDREGEPYIRGSISSIENWYSCPFRYFMASGLYVRRPQTPSLAADSIGTWQHAVMENAVFHTDGTVNPDYAAEMNEEKIRSLLHPWFEALRIVSPNDLERIALSEERMVHSLYKCAGFLKDYENSTSFLPAEAELTFRNYPVSDHVLLNGTIDRISRDPGNHMFEIIDYKSSPHALSEKKVKAGQQLQLITYLAAAYELYEKENGNEPAGAYYFSFTASDIAKSEEVKAASVNRTGWKLNENPLRQKDPEARKNLMIKNRKLSGWTFTFRADAIDRDGIYVSGLKKPYEYDAVRLCLSELYEYFYRQLTGEEGKPQIAARPVENACKYCDYHDICRFHGEPRQAETVYEEKLTKEKQS